MKTLYPAEKDLEEAKFINVTRLVYRDLLQTDTNYIQPEKRDYGRWDYDQGSLVLVTEEGRVWIGFTSFINGLMPLIHRVCPNGQGISFPCNIEVSTQLLLMRLRYPNGNIGGLYSPEPKL